MDIWKSAVSTLDGTIEDFFYKRMGNGEIFYGKRKVNPSGRVEGNYNGFGLSDKQRIEDFNVVKMERLNRKRVREEQRKFK
jgi:predicted secreted protein